jgi:hypothetical protein
MQLIQAFNANNYDPTQGVGGLPIGRHPVVICASEIKGTKDNSGGFLQLDLRIIDGPQQGTVGAYRLNLYNSSQQAVDIANKQMSAVCHVTGVFNVTDSQQLHDIPFIVEVGPQKNDPQYTEVKKVFDINGNEPGKGGQQQQQPQQNQQQNNQQAGNNNGAWAGQGQQNNNQQQQQNNQQQGGGNWQQQGQQNQNQQQQNNQGQNNGQWAQNNNQQQNNGNNNQQQQGQWQQNNGQNNQQQQQNGAAPGNMPWGQK